MIWHLTPICFRCRCFEGKSARPMHQQSGWMVRHPVAWHHRQIGCNWSYLLIAVLTSSPCSDRGWRAIHTYRVTNTYCNKITLSIQKHCFHSLLNRQSLKDMLLNASWRNLSLTFAQQVCRPVPSSRGRRCLAVCACSEAPRRCLPADHWAFRSTRSTRDLARSS